MRTSTTTAGLLLTLPMLLSPAGCQDPVSRSEGDPDLQVGNALLDGEADVTLRVEAEGFASGSPLTLVLENRSEEQVGYNLCFYALERRSGDHWTTRADPRVCTTELRLLGPDGTARFGTALPADLEPGVYRVRTALHLMDRDVRRDQVSGGFQVGS